MATRTEDSARGVHSPLRARTLTAVATALFILCLATGGARPSLAAPDADHPTLTLLSQAVWVDPNGTIVTRVHVAGAPRDAKIQALLYTRVNSRDTLQESFEGTPNGAYQLWQPPQPLDSFPASTDNSVDATLTIGLTDGTDNSSDQHSDTSGRALIKAPGVFPVQIRILGGGDVQLASLTTFAVRLPSTSESATDTSLPLQVATLLPLMTGPSRAPDGGLKVTAGTRALVAGIANSLRQSNASATRIPIAVAATPEVLASLAESAVPGDAGLVSDLAGALGNGELLQRPYVQIGLSSWVEDPRLVGGLNGLLGRGTAALSTLLHPPNDPTTWAHLAASPDDALTPPALDWLAGRGIRRLIVSSNDLSASSSGALAAPIAQPFTIESSSGPVTAWAIDPRLQADFAGGGTIAANRVLADLAFIALADPTQQRGVVLTPSPADVDPVTIQIVLDALRNPISTATTKPILSPVSLESLFALPPATADTGGSEPLVQSLNSGPAASLGAFAQQHEAVSGRVADLARMLGDTNRGVRALYAILDSTAAIQTTSELRSELLTAVDAQLANTTRQISLPDHQTVTLTARNAVVPLTIRNGLPTAATVTLHLDSSERLEFPDGASQIVRLEPGTTHLRLRVRTRTPGDATLRLQLTSPDGALLISNSEYTIHATGMSGVGVFISVGALAVVLLWWLRHSLNARRDRRERHIPPAELFDLPDGPTVDEPQPSDGTHHPL